LRDRPHGAVGVLANGLDRRERQSRFDPFQFHCAAPDAVQPAACGADPKIAFPVLGEAENLLVGSFDGFKTGIVMPEQAAVGSANPNRAFGIFEQRYRASSRVICVKFTPIRDASPWVAIKQMRAIAQPHSSAFGLGQPLFNFYGTRVAVWRFKAPVAWR
jgi:hypothetical protein